MDSSCGMYEIIDHTADIGILVRAPHMWGMLTAAARGLYAVMAYPVTLRHLDPGPCIHGVPFDAHDHESSLVNGLSALVSEESVVHYGPETLDLIPVGQDGRRFWLLIGRQQRSPNLTHREVKAVTYHNLKVIDREDGWLEATIIFDI